MDIQDLANDAAEFSVEHNKFTVNGTYKPSVLTPREFQRQTRMAQIAEESGDGDGDIASQTARFLSSIDMRWDVTNGGEPVSTEYESLLDVPFSVLVLVQRAILEHYQSTVGQRDEERGNGRRGRRHSSF